MKMLKRKPKWYNYKKIDDTGAIYRMIIGERSNGKTYGAMKKALENYVARGEHFALIRRFKDHMTTTRMNKYFNGLQENGEISKITKGEWDRVIYRSMEFYLAKWDDELGKVVKDSEPFGHGYSLNTPEADRGGDVPKVSMVVFDEFLTRSYYLPDEFVLFTNTLSTIIRKHDNGVVIYMLGNTVNRYCPYFDEMGLTKVKNQAQGTIDVYQYGCSDLTVAVEYCASMDKESNPTEKYFAFDNPRLKMITEGAWELDIYPHCPCKYTPKDVKFIFFVKWYEEILQCEIIKKDSMCFLYIHMKTTPLKNPDRDRIYQVDYNPRRNYFRKIDSPTDEIGKVIWSLFVKDKVFYQDNPTGEIMRNYLNWSRVN